MSSVQNPSGLSSIPLTVRHETDDFLNFDRIDLPDNSDPLSAGWGDTRIVCHYKDCKKVLGPSEAIKNFCRCAFSFCKDHIWYQNHDCTFDYKKRGGCLLEQDVTRVKRGRNFSS